MLHSTPTISTPAAQPAPHDPDLTAHGLTLYSSIFDLACAVFHALNRRLDLTDFNHTFKTLKLFVNCITAMTAIRLTLLRAPQRVTPRQLARLSRAARILTRLTGRAFDFTPWTDLTEEQLDRLSPSPSRRKPAPAPLAPQSPAQSETAEAPLPDFSSVNAVRCLGILANPGATLANFCQNLLRLAPPDFLLASTPAIPGAPAPAPSTSIPQTPTLATSPAPQPPRVAADPRRVAADPRFDRLLLQTFFPSRLPRPARPSRRHPPP